MLHKFLLLLYFFTISLSAGTYWIDNHAPDGGNGTSYETAWNKISSINWGTDTDVILNFVPSDINYTADSLVGDVGETSFIRIITCHSFIIQKNNSYGEGNVVFDGSYQMGNDILNNTYGVKAVPDELHPQLSNISINGIEFINFQISGVKVRGWTGSTLEPPQKMEYLTIENCKFTNITRRAIEVQYADYCNILNNIIKQELDVESETDGIFFNDNCHNINIINNYVLIKNNVYNSAFHVDGIQVSAGFNNIIGRFSGDVTIEYNTVINNSVVVPDVNRTVILITGIRGNLSIINNCLVSAKSQDLINITSPIDADTISNVTILNNTIVSKGSPIHLMFINNLASTNSPNIILEIKNNIFYKSGSGLYAIDFSNITSSYLPNETLSYNLFFNSEKDVRFTFSGSEQPWDFNNPSGAMVDPEFIDYDNNNYKLLFSSPAINTGLLIPSITKDRDYKKRPYWVGGVDSV